MIRVGLRLSPLDTLFFRDGRPFSAAYQADGDLPTPQPLAGALRTAILAGEPGFCFQQFASQLRRSTGDVKPALTAAGLRSRWYQSVRFRGPFLALQIADVSTPIPLLPVPLNIRRKQSSDGTGEWMVARPTENVPGWTGPIGANDRFRPLWLIDDEAEHPGGFITLPAIRHYLDGNTSRICDQDWFLQSDVYSSDFRTGIAVDAESYTAADSMIYGINLLALTMKVRRNWCRPEDVKSRSASPRFHDSRIVIYAEVLADDVDTETIRKRLDGPIPLGGEGRYVNCEPLAEEDAVNWPQPSVAAKKFWFLATPALLPTKPKSLACLPAALSANDVTAAATGQPLAVSGWDSLRRGPRPSRFALPAGSVFYTEGVSRFQDHSVCSVSDSVCEDVRQGWGFVLAGEET